ncbi:GFA family protein [Tropicimonas marinistellae]|uniref:GFA family protein n=1 Tax=Tropicimonas marinistellae TaxID=1739787 RepID=UPI00082A8840|nr:GFA family protein [Tropicimonas marinistellae]
MTGSTYKGQCFCGSVKIEVCGTPEGMGYCHCESCRSWSASPVNGFTLWNPENLTITEGAEHVGQYHKTENSHRKFCTKCGGHLMTDHPGMGLVDIYSAMLPELAFEPGLHVHYGEKVLRIPDGLPKFADLPGDFGGSDQQLPE